MNRFLLVWMMMLCAGLARAQDRFNIESFDPVTSSTGSLLRVYGGRALDRGHYALSLVGSYGRKPLSLENADGTDLGDLVGSVGTLHLLGAYGVWDGVEIGVGVPLHRVSAGSELENAPPALQSAALTSSKVAFGDIRLVPRANLYRHAGPAGFDVAALLPVWLPTGGYSAYAGESLRLMPGISLDYAARSWLVAFNVGYMFRSAAEVLGSKIDDLLQLGVGGSVGVSERFSLLAEVATHFNVLADDFGADDVATEALLGVRYRAQGGFGAQLAGGPGVTGGVGTPAYRIVASIGFEGAVFAPEPEASDAPELDADHDGIADAADSCIGEPEDRDGFDDEDGCPDPDNDADAIADAADRCPLQAEDRDGHEDADGCPDTDNDADGIADASDACPDQPGVAAGNGCPAPPPAPEAPAAVVVAEQKLELRETILFGKNGAEIQPESQPLIDAIAKVLTEHGEIDLVSIEGYTDDRGSPAHNLKLSQARAKAVLDALTARGIAAARLRARGFGLTQPLVPNDSDEQRAKNRRVELRIERRSQP